MDQVLIEQLVDRFTVEIKLAERTQKSSLSFHKFDISPTHSDFRPEKVQVIAIGGSVLHSAVVDMTRKSEELEVIKDPLPLLISKEIFLEVVEKYLQAEVNFLVLNFAHEISGEGVLVGASKEHKLEGLIGQNLAEVIRTHFLEKYNRQLEVRVANDVTCLILAGKSKVTDINTLVGCVIGTGINSGFFVDNDTVVNLESGNFDKFELSEAAKFIDSKSMRKDQWIEKELSGAYLFQHYNYYAEKSEHPLPLVTSTLEVSQKAESGSEQEKELALKVLRHSAQFATVQIAGIYKYKALPELTFIMEGSLFWKGHKYQEFVWQTLQELGLGREQISFIKVDHSYIWGAVELV